MTQLFSVSSVPSSLDITTPQILTSVKGKNPTKRELADDSHSAILAKKSASSDSSSSNTSVSRDLGRGDISSSTSFPMDSAARIHRYNIKDQPLFLVHVQSTQDSGSSYPLHISRVLSQIFPRDILEIKKVGRNKVQVQTNTYEAANRLVSNGSLSAHNLSAFIPSYKVLRTGIVRDVPQDISVELLRESISSPIKVLELHRLNRRTKSGTDIHYVPSRTVCLKFAGQSLPQFIYLFNSKYSVFPFISKTRICFSCFRVGYLSKACKSRPRCLHCGDAAHDSSQICAQTQGPPKCINCEGIISLHPTIAPEF